MADPKNIPDGGIESINEPGGYVKPVTAEALQKQPAPTAAKPATKHDADPDELEDEIDAAEDDDDVDVKHDKKKKR